MIEQKTEQQLNFHVLAIKDPGQKPPELNHRVTITSNFIHTPPD
jgi:hypothetical protein